MGIYNRNVSVKRLKHLLDFVVFLSEHSDDAHLVSIEQTDELVEMLKQVITMYNMAHDVVVCVAYDEYTIKYKNEYKKFGQVRSMIAKALRQISSRQRKIKTNQFISSSRHKLKSLI